MKSISIAKKILKDSTGYLEKNDMVSILIENRILQDPARSYKMPQDPTRFYGMLDKNGIEFISIENKILQYPTRFYGILDKNAMESISIANKILQDSTGY